MSVFVASNIVLSDMERVCGILCPRKGLQRMDKRTAGRKYGKEDCHRWSLSKIVVVKVLKL